MTHERYFSAFKYRGTPPRKSTLRMFLRNIDRDYYHAQRRVFLRGDSGARTIIHPTKGIRHY